MDFVGKALWYVETNFEDEFSLDEVATVAGVSKFHLVRAFRTCEPRRVCRRLPTLRRWSHDKYIQSFFN